MKTIIGIMVAAAVVLAAGTVRADEAREAQGCIYSAKFVRWVCPTPSNNFLRDPNYVEVQAGGDGAGTGAAGSGAGDGGASSTGTGGSSGGHGSNGCPR